MPEIVVEEVRKGPGRPKGSLNGCRFRNWQPKKWTVDYEMILAMHLLGKSNVEIAATVEKSVVHIGNVIACELAQKRLNEIRGRLKERTDLTVEEKITAIYEKSVGRVFDFINDDKRAESHPVAMVDRSMKAMEMINSRFRDSGNVTNNNMIFATEETIGKLTEALEMANKARELNAGKFKSISAVSDNITIRDKAATG